MNFRIVRDRQRFTLIFSFLFFFHFPILLNATTFTVNNTADKVDANPGDGLCADKSGNCTLRAAITEANALSGADTIDISAGTYTLSIEGKFENIAFTGDFDVTDNLEIIGAGADETIIDAAEIDRVFHIFAVVKISNLTIKNGYLEDNIEGDCGAISNHGSLTIVSSIVSKNFGMCEAFFGGISNRGTLTVINSTIKNNMGNGVDNMGGFATFVSSTISGNDPWGGISNGNGGELFLTNCTVSGNEWVGIYNGNGGSLIMTNSTVSENEDGITNCWNCTAEIINSMVSNNIGEQIFNNNGSLILTNSIVTDIDPLLGPLADNGGPTQTHALLSGSPAIDKGNDDACPANDQLGNPRVDGDGDGEIHCDIGSIEFQGIVLINDLVTFDPDPSTFLFTPDTTDCQAGAIGKFNFDATLTNISEKELSNLYVEVDELTNNNLLLTDDGLIGEGGRFEVPNSDDYADGYLSADEYVDVPFTVCLKIKKPFRFFVNVVGDAAD